MSIDPKIQNVYCVGRNFVEHAKELNNEIPEEPLFFQKSNACVNTEEIIKIPSQKDIDYEVEIVILIGRSGKPNSEIEAREFIQGYSVGLDLTDRKLQTKLKSEGLPWFSSKSFESSAVLNKKFISECPKEFYLKINNVDKQIGSTNDMIFSFEKIVLSLSKIISFREGDIIFTGTPQGVGILKKGDRVEMGFSKNNSFRYTVK